MPNVEIEAKMQVHDTGPLLAALKECAAKPIGEHHEVNVFFDTLTGSLRSSDQGLRTRVETKADGSTLVTITHKGPRTHERLKTRQETELVVLDPHGAEDLLLALGFVRILSFEKKRSRWTLDGCVVDIDTLPYLGTYVEIEGPNEKTILSVREKLGLSDLPLLQASYISMIKTHLSENRIQTDHVGFDKA